MLRRLRSADWAGWADAARRAVAADPAAFSASSEELARASDADWRRFTNRYCTPHSAAFVVEAGPVFGGMAFVGTVGVELDVDHDGVGLVTGLWVDPDHRRRGHARALLASAEQWSRDHSATSLVLTVAPGCDLALACYDAAGFVVVDPGVLLLRKSLV